MFNGVKRWRDRNQGLHDAADVSDVEMIPPAGWEPVEVLDASDKMEEEE